LSLSSRGLCTTLALPQPEATNASSSVSVTCWPLTSHDARAGQQLVRWNDFVNRAPVLRRLGIELLAGEDEVAAAYAADGFLLQQMDAITGRDA
jgi:hypothetical protein